MITNNNSLMVLINNLRIDAVPHIFQPSQLIMRMRWVFTFCCLTSFLLYMIINSLRDFLAYQVISTNRLQSDKSSVFPFITICNFNPLNSEYFVQLMIQANITELDSLNYYNMLQLEAYAKRTTGSYMSNEEKRKLSNADAMIISCMFDGKKCSFSNFTFFFDQYYLGCVQFNSGRDSNGQPVELKTVSRTGETSGLTLELYVGLPNAISKLQTGRRGVYVFINKQGQNFEIDAASPKELTPGFATNILLERREYNQFNEWPYTYSSCTLNSDGTFIKPLDDLWFFEQTTSTNLSYSRNSCLALCVQYYCSQYFGCLDYGSCYKLSGYDYCLTDEQWAQCYDFYYGTFMSGDFIEKNCYPKCPLECTQHQFVYHQSIYEYPDPSYLEQTLRKNPILIERYSNDTDFQDLLTSSVVKFSIYYDNHNYMIVNEEPKLKWDELLGHIGGHLHLFMGMSILAFVEIFELIIACSIFLINKKVR